MPTTPVSRVGVQQVACPQSTIPPAFVEVPLTFPTGVLRAFEIVIPAGHSGLTGIALGYGHVPVIPYGGASFFSGDDDVIASEYIDHVPGVQWSVFMQNGDLQQHVWEVRFYYDELSSAPVEPVTQAVTTDEILAAGDAISQEAANVPAS